MKVNRHSIILQLIDEFNIDTQEELTARLKDSGIDVTQATVSRDIRELNLIKVLAEDGKYKYAPYNLSALEFDEKILNVFKQAVSKIDFAGNFLCIHTMRGMANAAAVAIDSLKYDEILGCVAGDDTILILTRNEKKAEELVKYFKQIISG